MLTITSYKNNWMLPLRNILGIVALFPLLVLIGCVSISTGHGTGKMRGLMRRIKSICSKLVTIRLSM